MKILFISPPWGDVYGNYTSAAKIGNAYPPLGLCYLAAVLKDEGHTSRIIDAETEEKNLPEMVRDIEAYAPDIIGISAVSPLFGSVKHMAKIFKEHFPSIPIVIGGPHCTAVGEECLDQSSDIDYCLAGEAESAIIGFMDFLEGKITRDDVRGLMYRDEGGTINKNPLADLIRDLDSIPIPLRDKLKLDKYTWSVPGKGIVKFTTIMTSRGCPFNCVFCSAHTIFGKKVRTRLISKVLDELEFLVAERDIRHFAFIDDTLTLDHGRVKELCDGIRERNLDITWEGWTRANTVDYDILKMMKDAGFVRVSFGIESADETVSKIIQKGVPLEAYTNAYRDAKKAGLETRASIILGNPGETRETAMKTLNFVKRLKGCDQVYINIATPYPATTLYEMAKTGQYGMKLLTNNLAEYKRYGDAVIEVNDLKREDLVELQRKGFMMFYFRPGRIWYNFKRAGLMAFLKNALAFFKSVICKKR